jgi:O-antigen/teichoic acid export membrane protein
MLIMTVGLLARASLGPVERLLNMLGEQRACAAVYAMAFVLNVVVGLVLIPRLGIYGAAIATSTALVIESVALFFVTKRRLGFHVFIWGR